MVTILKARDIDDVSLSPRTGPVSVNGVEIGADAIAREVQQHVADLPHEAWTAAARALAVKELLLQEARRCGTSAVPRVDEDGRRETDDEAMIRQLVDDHVTTPDPDDAACRRYYDANRQRFRSADIYEAAHILFAARPGADDPLADARRSAALVLDLLARRPELFGELAALHSACPSAKSGGNLGQISKGDTTPAFEAALASLETGGMTREPVSTPYGLHIIRLDRRIDGALVPFSAVREQIAVYLAEASFRQAAAHYLARLAAGARIEGVELPTPADLRVY